MPLFEIFTDGSCHTQHRIGAWAAIVIVDTEKTMLSGHETDTTHNRMELLAVIKALQFVESKCQSISEIKIVSDSQYVVGLRGRKQKFIAQDFKTKSGKDIQNIDLVQQLLKLVEKLNPGFVKIKAHQNKSTSVNYNIEVDKLSRKIVRSLL